MRRHEGLIGSGSSGSHKHLRDRVFAGVKANKIAPFFAGLNRPSNLRRLSAPRVTIRGMTNEKTPEAPVFRDQPEEAAYNLVPVFLGGGVAAECNDHSGRQGVVDFLLHYPDGPDAAMEVTSAAGEGKRQLYALLARHETLPNPGARTWNASIDHPRDLPELLDRCSRIITYCEANGIVWPKHAYAHRTNPDIWWLMTSSADLHGSPDLPKWDAEKVRERPLFLTQGGSGGTVNESLSRFAEAVDEVLVQHHVQKRVLKLGRSGYDEQHLFLVIDHTSLPFDVFYGLTRGTVTPPTAPTLPGSVTHLWLLITFTPSGFLVTNDGLQVFDRNE